MIDYPKILEEAWQQHLAPRADNAPTVISTFAGGGGSSLGYSMAGYRELLAVEFDKNAVDTFKLNFPDVPVYFGDIAKLSVEECLKLANVKPRELDIFDGSPPCFTKGQRVMSKCGKIPIEFCTAGMEVITHAGKLRKVIRMFEKKYSGQLYTIETKYGRKPVTSTPEHPFFARQRVTKTRDSATRKNSTRYKAYEDPRWIDAKDLKVGDVLCEPHVSGEPDLLLPPVVHKQRINIEGQSGVDASEMRLINKNACVDWHTSEMAWLLGFYLAEGHTRGKEPVLESDGACRREVILSIADKETVLIVDKLNAVGYHAQVQKHSQGCTRITVNDIDLWTLVQCMGKGASGKFVPVAFMCMPIDWQAQFLDGYFTGDGCVSISKRIKSQKRKATTVSWDIATGIAKMVARVFGLVAGIEVLYPAGMSKIQGRDVEVKEAYSVGYVLETSERVRPGFVDDFGAWLPIKKIGISDVENEPVFNMEVEGDNSYTVEDIAVHNCQGFSTAGKRDMADDRNQLFREYVRLLRGLQPKVFLMENVSGMVKGKMKLIFAEILRELKASGYKVSARLLNAKYFHVPQSRERMIFVGVRDDLGIEPSHPKAQSAGITTAAAFKGITGMGDAKTLTTLYQSYWRKAGQGGTVGKQSCVVRLNAKQVPPTLQKSEGNGAPYHPAECRAISTDERKRIGSFPAEFRFTGRESATERIGNSVPPLMMKAIALHIRENILDAI